MNFILNENQQEDALIEGFTVLRSRLANATGAKCLLIRRFQEEFMIVGVLTSTRVWQHFPT